MLQTPATEQAGSSGNECSGGARLKSQSDNRKWKILMEFPRGFPQSPPENLSDTNSNKINIISFHILVNPLFTTIQSFH
jgi:hypothetical protein